MKNHFNRFLFVFLFLMTLVLTFGFSSLVIAQDNPENNILTIREAMIKDGKFMEAMQFAKEITAYVNNKFPDHKARLYFRIFGEVGKIYWVSERKDLATMEMENKQLMVDPGYNAILGKAVGCFIEGKVYDTIMVNIK